MVFPHLRYKNNKLQKLPSLYIFLGVFIVVAISSLGAYFIVNSSAQAMLEVYPAPAGITADSSYTVKIDGQNSFVYPSTFGAFTNFSFSGGTIQVTVDTIATISTVKIRPQRDNIQPQFTVGAKTLTFTISQPGQYSVEINGISTPLFVFANTIDTNKPSKTDPNVMYYDGGQVYNTGEIVVPSNKTLYVEGGAVVRGKIRVGPGTPTGTAVSNVRIAGRGIVDSTLLADPGRPVRVQKSSNVTVEGLTFLGREAWGVVTYQSSAVTYKNIKVINWRELTDTTPDGMDILGSSNVTVEDSFIRSYDDGIAVKNNKNGWVGDVDTVLIQRMVIWNGDAGNGINIGWENNANYIRNITYKDIDIIHKTAKTPPLNRAAISIQVVDGATISNVQYDDIRVEDAQEHLIRIGIMKNGTSLTSNVGMIQDVWLKNIYAYATAVGLPVVIEGKDDLHKVTNVKFENLMYSNQPVTSAAQANAQITYANNVTFVTSPQASTSDLNNDGVVNIFDLSVLLGRWSTTDATADVNKDGTVNVFDLSILLNNWSV